MKMPSWIGSYVHAGKPCYMNNKICGRMCTFRSIYGKLTDLTLQRSNIHYPKQEEFVLGEFWIPIFF